MTFSSCLNKEDSQIALDSSVVINLLATGEAIAILEAVALPTIVADSVVREIGRGNVTGRPELVQLDALIASDLMRVVRPEGRALELFVGLVSGSTVESLGDGEAATIALAHETKSLAAIDEKKATRIVTSRFTGIRVATTIDLLAHSAVESGLGRERLADATLQALRVARMQVREHQFDWIVDLIGPENVPNCPSLNRLAGHRLRASRRKIAV